MESPSHLFQSALVLPSQQSSTYENSPTDHPTPLHWGLVQKSRMEHGRQPAKEREDDPPQLLDFECYQDQGELETSYAGRGCHPLCTTCCLRMIFHLYLMNTTEFLVMLLIPRGKVLEGDSALLRPRAVCSGL